MDVAIVRYPHVGEEQELAPLAADESARVITVESGDALGRPDLVVLPGSEKTLADLDWMRATGLLDAVRAAHQDGAVVLGICGGLQVMGTRLEDPLGLQGGGPLGEGLGLLPVHTTFAPDPVEEPSVGTSTGTWLPEGLRVAGRELHGGRSVLAGAAVPLFREMAKGGGHCPLGLASPRLDAIATYLHDVLLASEFRSRLLSHVAARRRPTS